MPKELDHFVPRSSLDPHNHTFLDLHLHTKKSIDGKSKPKKILKTASERKIDFIAITEHDKIRKQKELEELIKFGQELDPPVGIINAIEITTIVNRYQYPHIILLDVISNEVDKYLGKIRIPYVMGMPKLNDFFIWLIDQKASGKMNPVVVAAHPVPQDSSKSDKKGFKDRFHNWQTDRTSLTFEQIRNYAPFIDVIEVVNDKHNSIDKDRLALARALNKPGIGGSDAHHAHELGIAGTYAEGKLASVQEVIEAIKLGVVGTFYSDF